MGKDADCKGEAMTRAGPAFVAWRYGELRAEFNSWILDSALGSNNTAGCQFQLLLKDGKRFGCLRSTNIAVAKLSSATGRIQDLSFYGYGR